MGRQQTCGLLGNLWWIWCGPWARCGTALIQWLWQAVVCKNKSVDFSWFHMCCWLMLVILIFIHFISYKCITQKEGWQSDRKVLYNSFRLLCGRFGTSIIVKFYSRETIWEKNMKPVAYRCCAMTKSRQRCRWPSSLFQIHRVLSLLPDEWEVKSKNEQTVEMPTNTKDKFCI